METLIMIIVFVVIVVIRISIRRAVHSGVKTVYKAATKDSRENDKHELIRGLGDNVYRVYEEVKEEEPDINFEDVYSACFYKFMEELKDEGKSTQIKFLELLDLNTDKRISESKLQEAALRFKREVKDYVNQVYQLSF